MQEGHRKTNYYDFLLFYTATERRPKKYWLRLMSCKREDFLEQLISSTTTHDWDNDQLVKNKKRLGTKKKKKKLIRC